MNKHFLAVFLLLLLPLAACIPDTQMHVSDRFNIAAYQSAGNTDDITGIWLSIHRGERVEESSDLTLKAVGSTREIVEISRFETPEGPRFFHRSCLDPIFWRPISADENQLQMTMNGNQIKVSVSTDQRQMSGNATYSSSSISYSATVAMKKIADSNKSFGSFDFFNLHGSIETLTASCFQESDLRVTGTTKGLIRVSQWSDLEAISVVSRIAGGSYRQAGYVRSIAGNADPVNTMLFVTRDEGFDQVNDSYPQADQTMQVENVIKNASGFSADYSIQPLFSASMELSL